MVSYQLAARAATCHSLQWPQCSRFGGPLSIKPALSEMSVSRARVSVFSACNWDARALACLREASKTSQALWIRMPNRP